MILCDLLFQTYTIVHCLTHPSPYTFHPHIQFLYTHTHVCECSNESVAQCNLNIVFHLNCIHTMFHLCFMHKQNKKCTPIKCKKKWLKNKTTIKWRMYLFAGATGFYYVYNEAFIEWFGACLICDNVDSTSNFITKKNQQLQRNGD